MTAGTGTTMTTTDVSVFILNLPGAAKTATATATNATVNRAGDGEAEDAVPDFLDALTLARRDNKCNRGPQIRCVGTARGLGLERHELHGMRWQNAHDDHGRANNSPVVQGERPVPVKRA